jgi:hypothetical protein
LFDALDLFAVFRVVDEPLPGGDVNVRRKLALNFVLLRIPPLSLEYLHFCQSAAVFVRIWRRQTLLLRSVM